MAACRRRSLSHLSRRLHPSVAGFIPNHFHDDRDRSDPRTPSFFSRSFYSANLGKNRSSSSFKTLNRDIGFYLPLGADQFFNRNYSSSGAAADGSNEIGGYLKDVADVLKDTGVEATAAAAVISVPAPFPGEVAAAAADSFLPVAALQYLIDGVHSFTGVNWWAAIALTTVLIRCSTIPFLLNQMRSTVKLNAMRPELEEIKEQMQNSVDPESLQEGRKQMTALFQKHGVTPFTPLKGMFIQGPIFISFFWAISNMAEKVPSFKGGGAFWFTDLTTPDPQYVLPVVTALTFLATVELNMQEGMEGNPMLKTMKNFSRGLAVMTVPFTASFPKAIFCYWVTSNVFSLIYGFVIKRPQVKKFLNLPDIVPQPAPASQSNFSLFGGSKLFSLPASPITVKTSEPSKSSGRRASSSAVMSHRIRSLEKTVKARNKTKRS